jgi:predicted amidophosphoribosyltransferase
MPLAETLAPVVDLIFPPRRPLCSEGIPAQTGLCSGVWNELAIAAAPACTLCQGPLGDRMMAVAVCAPCLAEGPRHDRIAAGTLYNDVSRPLVQAFKHGQRIAQAPRRRG